MLLVVFFFSIHLCFAHTMTLSLVCRGRSVPLASTWGHPRDPAVFWLPGVASDILILEPKTHALVLLSGATRVGSVGLSLPAVVREEHESSHTSEVESSSSSLPRFLREFQDTVQEIFLPGDVSAKDARKTSEDHHHDQQQQQAKSGEEGEDSMILDPKSPERNDRDDDLSFFSDSDPSTVSAGDPEVSGGMEDSLFLGSRDHSCIHGSPPESRRQQGSSLDDLRIIDESLGLRNRSTREDSLLMESSSTTIHPEFPGLDSMDISAVSGPVDGHGTKAVAPCEGVIVGLRDAVGNR